MFGISYYPPCPSPADTAPPAPEEKTDMSSMGLHLANNVKLGRCSGPSKCHAVVEKGKEKNKIVLLISS
jgi:hypothetical protein